MTTTVQYKSDLDTPCLVLDMDVLEGNLEMMKATAAAAGKNLRPHVKTHKCSSLARKQIEAGAIGVCVAKLSEADRAIADAQKVCPVTGEPLGSMGVPVKVTVKDRDVLLCCEGCKSAILDDPDTYLAKLDAD